MAQHVVDTKHLNELDTWNTRLDEYAATKLLLISKFAGVQPQRFYDGELTQAEWDAINAAIEELAQLPITIGRPTFNPE